MTNQQTGRYRLSGMELDFVSLVPAGDDPLASVVISKAASAPGDKSTDVGSHRRTLSRNELMEEKMGTINKSELAPEVVEYIDGLEGELDTLATQVAKAEEALEEAQTLNSTLSKSAPEATQAEIRKAAIAKADPALRAILEDQQAQIEKSDAIAKAEREQRLEREFISKAETLSALPGETSSIAGLLRRAADALSPEDNAALDTVLKSADAQIRTSGIFKSLGAGGGETTISKSVRSMAEEIKKGDPSLTIEQAEARVYEENPELANRALNGEEA